jgi:hypothetical protein
MDGSQGTVQITASAGTAFKLGFFGFLGAFVASLALGVGLAIGIVLLGGLAKLGADLQQLGAAPSPAATTENQIEDGSACGFGVYSVKRPDLVGVPLAKPSVVHPAPATIQCPVTSGSLAGTLTVSVTCEGGWSECVKPTALIVAGRPVSLQLR